MLNTKNNFLNTNALTKPTLIIVIDTEEEFDWNQPFDRKNTHIKNIAYQEKAQKIFEKFNIKPTYVIDYPVASQPESFKPLKELYDAQQCDIGAHLHPWVTPPFNEQVNNYNSFPGNLTYQQEYEKLEALTLSIENNFNFQPTIYKAGRYGIGKHTHKILNKLGYTIDCSTVPHTDFSMHQGPDFTELKSSAPYWLDNELLEIPLSVDYVGPLSQFGSPFYKTTQKEQLVKLKIPAILSKLGLFERIRLSPEGHSTKELIRLTKNMINRNHKVFCLTYHSSTLMPGGSPYVQNQKQLDLFLHTIEQYLEFFNYELHGSFSSINEIHKRSK